MNFSDFEIYLKDHLKIELTATQNGQLKTYLAMLKEWNELFNLTAIVEEQKIIEKHFLDSLLPLKYMDLKGKSLIDVGTGAGFPGLVIAIMCQETKVTLLEPNNKKVRFLKDVTNKLLLNNVEIIMGRSEMQNDLRSKFDVAIARAVKPLNILLELVTPLIKVKGYFIAMKSQGVEEEIKQAKRAFSTLNCKIVSIHQDTLPTDKDVRINLIVIKHDLTPVRYPRSYNLISAKPL